MPDSPSLQVAKAPKTKFAKWRKRILFSIFLLLAVIYLIPGGAATFRKAVFAILPTPSPYTVELTGSAKERGRIHGKKMKWAIQLLDKIYIRHFAPGENLNLYLKKAEELFDRIDPAWSEEIEGMTEATGVESGILKLGNSFLDLGLNASGCRQIHLKLGDRLLHSHNLDWDNLGGVGNYLVTIYRSSGKEGAFRTVHLAFPGMIGVLDIINEHGVALSFNQIGLGRKDSSRMPVFIAMREIAESCFDFDAAREKILNMPPGMPFCIGLTDAKRGRMAVFERDVETTVIERKAETLITADNMAWGETRKGEIQTIAEKANPQSLNELIALLRDERILLGCNIYSVIFDYRNNTMYLASGDVPAATGKYRQFPLFH